MVGLIGGNAGFVTLTGTGLNSIAVAASMAKEVLKDQSLPMGYTLYGVLDMVIEKTRA